MQTTSHTPGAWQTTGLIVFAQRNPGGRKLYIADASQDAGLDASLANARLIAAAPDLLEACKSVLGQLSDAEINECPQYAAMRTAIAKAEGCMHNKMVRREDEIHVWECADCGHIYGQ